MSYEVEIRNAAPNDWNAFIKNSNGTVYQTSHWANYLKKYYHARPFFLCIRNNNKLVGGLLMLKESVYQNLLSKNFGACFTTLLASKLTSTITWNCGPLLIDPNCKEILKNALAVFIKRNKISKISATANIFGDNLLLGQFNHNSWSTFILDLRSSKQDLFSKLKKSLRKNIRRGLKKGLEISTIQNKSELRDYCKFYTMTKNLFTKINYSKYLKNMICVWDHLRPFMYYNIFVAKYDGNIVAGLTAWGFNKTVHEAAVARSEFEKRNKLYAQDLIKWYAICHAKKNKFKWFDLSGAAVTPKNTKEENILKYKRKWGGQQIQYVLYDL